MTVTSRGAVSQRRHVPAYREHKPSGQARVIIEGRQIYLGRFGTPESWEKYHQHVTKRFGQPASTSATFPDSNHHDLTVVELADAYRAWAEGYYVKNGQTTGHIHQIKRAVRALRETHGRTLAHDFGPLKFRACSVGVGQFNNGQIVMIGVRESGGG